MIICILLCCRIFPRDLPERKLDLWIFDVNYWKYTLPRLPGTYYIKYYIHSSADQVIWTRVWHAAVLQSAGRSPIITTVGAISISPPHITLSRHNTQTDQRVVCIIIIIIKSYVYCRCCKRILKKNTHRVYHVCQ